MARFTFRSVLSRRRRASISALAVLVGVSMIVGTFVYTDTIDAAFHDLFGAAARGADVIVTGRQNIASPVTAPASIPVSLINRIRSLRGVAAAQGRISDTATVLGRSGRVVKVLGAPTVAISYLTPPFSGMEFVAGRAPSTSSEVALDRATATRQGYRVGDLVPIVTGEPLRRFRVSGIVRLGSASLRGASFVVFDLAAAQQLYGRPGRADVAYVATAPGTPAATVIQEIRPLLGPELVVRTASAQVDSDVSRVSDRLRLLTGGLLAFGVIAIVVGALVIFNTFTVTATQRAREFALLRALGATRAQLLGSMLGEALVIGVLASAAGVAGGVLAAQLIRAPFGGVGVDLPSTALVISLRTVTVGVAVGVLVTLAAGLLPAVRAARAAPLEALRESELTLAPTRALRWLLIAAAGVLTVAGLVLIFTSSGTTASRLERSAAGALAIVIAIVVLGPLVVGPIAGLVSWPMGRRNRMLPVMARENAARSPSRTAVSATSLMIGIALVLFATIYASGLRASTTRIIDRTFLGDFTIESQDGYTPIPAAAARTVAVVPDVLAVSSLKTADAQLGRTGSITAEGIDPETIGQVYRFDWVQGSPATLQSLAPGDVIVERDTAASANLHVGDRVTMRTETGLSAQVTVRGIYADRALLSGFALPRTAFDQLFHQSKLEDVFVKLGPGADPVTTGAALRQALGVFPGVLARSNRQLAHQVASRVNSILVLFYALLAISVLVSLIGIAGTLNLSIYERTRELGMLRAIGMTRRQTRVLIREESLITAAIGALTGAAVGIFLAWVVSRAQAADGIVFSPPWAQVAAVLAAGLIAGILAGIPPARRAGRLDVLQAIANE